MPLTPPYSLLTRTAKGSQLTIEEMDGNLLWLSTTLSGSINSITGSLGISGSNIEIVTSLFNLFSETLITGSVTINPNSIPNPISGSYTLGGSVTFNGDLTIASGSELIIPAGVAFTLNGALINNGDLVNSGSYINLAPTSPYMTLSVLGNVSASAYYGDGSNLTGITAATASYSFFAVSASYAVSASHEIIKEVSSSYADFAVTASYVDLVAGPNVTINRVGTSFEISSSGGGGSAFPYTGSAVITGSLVVTGSSVLSGSVTLNDITYPTTDGDNGDIIYTNGAGVLTFDKTKVCAPVKNVSGGTLYKGTPVHASSSIGNANEVIAASASVASTMPATFVLAQDLADEEEGLGIVTGFLNGVDTSAFEEGQVVYVGENGGYTNVKPSGSNLIQNLGIITKVAVNGSGYIYGAGRSNDTPNLLHNQIFFGSGSDQQYQIHISGALDSTVINNITASGNISASGNIYANTGSFEYVYSNIYEGSGSGTVVNIEGDVSASGYISASYFVGDGSQLQNLPASAAFPYTGSAIITGSIEITGSVNSTVTVGVRSQGLVQITDDDTASVLPAYNTTGSINGMFLNSGSNVPISFVGTTEIPSFGGLTGGGFIMNSGSSVWSAGGQYTLGGTFTQLYYDPDGLNFPGAYTMQVGQDNIGEDRLILQKTEPTGEGIQLKTSNLTEGFVLNHSFSNSSASLFKVFNSGSTTTIFDVTEAGTIAYRPIGTHNTDFTCSVSGNAASGNGYGGHYVRVTGNITCSIQPNSVVSIPIGVEFEFFQTDVAQLYFESASGVTLNSKDGALKLTGQFSAATLKKVDTDEWDLIGDLS